LTGSTLFSRIVHMNKKILSALIAVLIAVPTSSFASVKNSTLKNSTSNVPTLAILDTAIDNSIPAIKEKLIYEVCILEWTTCPNGRSFMEGTNSATLPLNAITKNGFDHGTQMASAAIQSNPNMNIVFVRIVGQNINFDRQISTDATVWMALDWVLQNKNKFNIQAVAMSQGHHNLPSLPDYCPKSPIVESKIKSLLDIEVPVFLAAGNSYDYKKIDWPSCIPNSIAIGGATKNGIELFSNYDANLIDFTANSRSKVFIPGGSVANATGTSISTQVAAATWLAVKSAKPTLSYTQLYDLIKSKSKPVKGKQGSSLMIDLAGALNG
jgi:hypothetical protein